MTRSSYLLFPNYGTSIYKEANNSLNPNNPNRLSESTLFGNMSPQKTASPFATALDSHASTDVKPRRRRKTFQLKQVAASFDSRKLSISGSIQEVADEKGVIIGIRTPNPASEYLLQNHFPSKEFGIGVKSSPFGPMAGLLPQNYQYSKTNDPIAHEEHIQYTDTHHNNVEFRQLSLPDNVIQNRIEEGYMREEGYKVEHQYMIENGSIVQENSDNILLPHSDSMTSMDSGYSTDTYVPPRTRRMSRKYSAQHEGKKYSFTADENNRFYEENGMPLEILHYREDMKEIKNTSRPITGDVDPFAVLPSAHLDISDTHVPVGVPLKSDARKKDSSRNEYLKANKQAYEIGTLDYNERKKYERYSGFQKKLSAHTFPEWGERKEDKKMANASGLAISVANRVNRYAREKIGYQGGNIIHHGPESTNPFSKEIDIKGDTPTFFIPDQPPQQVNTRKQLKKLLDEAERNGYAVREIRKRYGV